MTLDADAIVIGSGFGGAVTACRLAAAGYRVVVLERGRDWSIDATWTGPDEWFFDAADPARRNGWFDLRVFGRMSTVAGAGVGGGSLHYANTSIDAPSDAFDAGWPAAIRHETLAPHYARVKAMLGSGPVPTAQEPRKLGLLRDAAERLGYGRLFGKVDLAITFDPDLAHDSADPPLDPSTIARTPNRFGVVQGTCAHLGECIIGCRAQARNMLGTNYIASARNDGAQVLPLHVVRRIRPESGGYVVDFDEIAAGGLRAGRLAARIVIVSAGSVSSSELLLRCRDEHATLPALGPMVGRRWSSNTNYLTLADHPHVPVFPTRGPNITAAVGFFGSDKHMGAAVNMEDGGFPGTVGAPPGADAAEGFWSSPLLAALHRQLAPTQLLEHVMPWFSQGRDESTGTFSLGPRVADHRALHLDWNPAAAEKPMAAILDLHERMARATGGVPPPSLWPILKSLVTPHPLGGCPMADDPQHGVVNDRGESFGYRNLYVADGSIVPTAIGVNPSKTIAALADRIADGIIAEGR